jgi:hypothetical protein
MHRSRRKNLLIPLQISSSLIGQNNQPRHGPPTRRHDTFAYTLFFRLTSLFLLSVCGAGWEPVTARSITQSEEGQISLATPTLTQISSSSLSSSANSSPLGSVCLSLACWLVVGSLFHSQPRLAGLHIGRKEISSLERYSAIPFILPLTPLIVFQLTNPIYFI